jgi:peptidyl-prolyl cis-trans isomerase B (cyclophilin B)
VKRLLLAALSLCLLSAAACDAANNDDKANHPVVIIETSMGTIKAELYEDKAPITVKNFLDYVDDKFYDGTIFHRVIADFMIQGGGFKPGLKDARTEGEVTALEKKTKDAIKNEAKTSQLSNRRGTLAMARLKKADTATAQFFINVENNNKLDAGGEISPDGYAVFGKVIEGMDVVDKIRAVKTTSNSVGMDDIPVEDVIIKSIRRADAK